MRKLLLSVGLLFSLTANAGISIIVHPSNSTPLENKDISRIFLGKVKSFNSELTAMPMNLPEGNPSRKVFEKSVLNKSSNQIKAYWSKLVFTGKGTPPLEAISESELVNLVSANPNLIAYVDDSLVTDKVKVVAQF